MKAKFLASNGTGYRDFNDYSAVIELKKVSIISIGNYSEYHHPAASKVDRTKKAGAKVYETILNGTIYVSTDGESYNVVTEK